MGFFAVRERAIAIAKTSFSDDLAAILTAAQRRGPKTVTIYEGLSAEEFGPGADADELPGLGIFTPSGQTSAVVVGKRDWNVSLVFDFFVIGATPAEVSALVDFGAAAILKTVDRMVTDGTVIGTVASAEAGGVPFSVAIEFDGSSRVAGGSDYYQDRVRVTVPVVERDIIT